MAGHLFVTRGDLTALHCDHWLLPVDAGLSASRTWRRSAAWARIAPDLPDALPTGVRVTSVPWDGPRRPWPGNVASGRSTPATWQADTVRAFLDAAHAAGPTRPDRDRPLLALPLVGTGFGGKRREAGEVLRAVLPAIWDWLATHDADVALVTWEEEDFAAAQATRRAFAAAGAPVWPAELDEGLRAAARDLATRASRGGLAVFLGAGVSASAGLPTWGELLDRLAAQAGFDDDERRRLAALGPLDRAQLVAQRLGPEPALGRAVAGLLDAQGGVSLAHQLLAALPVREFVTTNYDDCFERACDAVGRPVARLPYAPASRSDRWLLKMHGCVRAPEDIVLTRRDYVRYAERNAALAGIVQAMLVTRHMWFVGFGLDDDNFHRIVDAVRRAVTGADRDRLGSAVTLFANPLLEQLWTDELDWIPLAAPGSCTTAAAARRFELLLDHVGFHAASPRHLLDPRFAAVLTDEERALRDAMHQLRGWLDAHPPRADDPSTLARRLVEDLLEALGDAPPEARRRPRPAG
jgi:hypothetical protein